MSLSVFIVSGSPIVQSAKQMGRLTGVLSLLKKPVLGGAILNQLDPPAKWSLMRCNLAWERMHEMSAGPFTDQPQTSGGSKPRRKPCFTLRGQADCFASNGEKSEGDLRWACNSQANDCAFPFKRWHRCRATEDKSWHDEPWELFMPPCDTARKRFV